METRKTADNPCEFMIPISPLLVEYSKTDICTAPSRTTVSPLKSPAVNRPASLPVPPAALPVKRGPRPSSLAVDKSAPVEDQFAALKNVFARAGLGASQGGEPLSEIDDPQTR